VIGSDRTHFVPIAEIKQILQIDAGYLLTAFNIGAEEWELAHIAERVV